MVHINDKREVIIMSKLNVAKKLKRDNEAGKCYSLSRKQAVQVYGAENVSKEYEPDFPIKRKRKTKS